MSMSIVFVKGMLPDLTKKYEVVLLSSPGPEMEEAKKEGLARCIAVPMERHISPIKDFVSLCKLIRVFRKERPDMVHSMTPKAGLLCMTAGWLTRVPVRIHTFTGLVFPTSTGLKKRILMLTDALTCRFATHVIPEGEGVKADLLNNGITHKPLRILGYGNVMGIDMQRFSHKNLCNDNSHTEPTVAGRREKQSAEIKKNTDITNDTDRSCAENKTTTNCTDKQEKTTTISPREEVERGCPFSFLFVGRIVRDKGINELVEAFERLNKEIPETRLVLIGKFEENLDPISDKAKEIIDNNPNIDAVGPQYGDDLLAHYAAADCFVFPSYREGFPNTVIEAGAMGLPSIVTDINGSREIITNEKFNENAEKKGHADLADLADCCHTESTESTERYLTTDCTNNTDIFHAENAESAEKKRHADHADNADCCHTESTERYLTTDRTNDTDFYNEEKRHADCADHADCLDEHGSHTESTERYLTTNCTNSTNTVHEEINFSLTSKCNVKKNGIIIPSKDAEALYEAMEIMIEDDAMRESMAKNARPMIESRFEQGFVRKCLYDFYEEVLLS